MMLCMKQRIAILLLATSAIPAHAKKLDWEAIEKIPPGTHILVMTRAGNECAFQRATEDQLFCTLSYPGSDYRRSHPDLVFNRSEIKDVCVGEYQPCSAFDASAGPISLLLAFQSGGGWSSGYQPSSFAGVRLGLLGATLDLQYDRVNGSTGFSTEGSAMIPVLRVPKYDREHDRLFFRVYAEPGLGYRAGGKPFGQYTSAKALVLFGSRWVDGKASPYVEFQHRFPFNSPINGDNRLAVGIMWALCHECGLN